MSKKTKEKKERKGMPQEVPKSYRQKLAPRRLRAELAYILRAALTIEPIKSPKDSNHEEVWKKLINRQNEILETMLSLKPDKGGKEH